MKAIQANRLQDYEAIQANLPKAIQANPPAGEAGPTNVEAGRCTGVLVSDSANRFTGSNSH